MCVKNDAMSWINFCKLLSKINQFHENIVQYLIMEEDNNATYIALALYKGNFRDLLRDAVSSGYDYKH